MPLHCQPGVSSQHNSEELLGSWLLSHSEITFPGWLVAGHWQNHVLYLNLWSGWQDQQRPLGQMSKGHRRMSKLSKSHQGQATSLNLGEGAFESFKKKKSKLYFPILDTVQHVFFFFLNLIQKKAYTQSLTVDYLEYKTQVIGDIWSLIYLSNLPLCLMPQD